jgi:hypothetical protein
MGPIIPSAQPASLKFSFPLEVMEVTGKSKTGEAGHKALIARAEARAAQPPPVVAEPQRHAEGRMAKSKSEGVNFHIEITVTSGLWQGILGASHRGPQASVWPRPDAEPL